MSLSATTIIPANVALQNILAMASGVKGAAQAALSALQTTNVDTNWCFNFIDQMKGMIGSLNTWKSVGGLNAAATASMTGYAGTMTTDIDAVVTAANNCINWIVANFPKDTTNTYILAFTLNADGTRTSRTFTPAQTAGLQTLVQAFIASIG